MPEQRQVGDRNLLFGILALQMDFISRDALVAAMQAWVLEKSKPLGEILVAQGAMAADARALLEPLVQKHVEMHDNDPQKSLASVSPGSALRRRLEQIIDEDMQASLAHVSMLLPAGDDTLATQPHAVGTPTSSGLRFRVLRPHARGGLGQVSVALDEELRREVALKEIQHRHADHPESRSRFVREAEITGGLEHPGIVPVYGLGAYPDGRPFYAMRFIKGDSLQEAIARFHEADGGKRDPRERTLALRQLLGRFIDVCDAIAYAHSRGVLHRDLKPGNVMLGPYGETLVVDWGLAKPMGVRVTDGNEKNAERTLRPALSDSATPTQAGAALGTPAFMPPEQAAGRLDELGPTSDVYSLGATLYCLLTGKPPFEGRDVAETLRRVQAGDFPRPRAVRRDVPAALESVCLKAMALKPQDRYAGPRALAADVERWLADEPVSAYREPSWVRAARWSRRRPILALWLAVSAVAYGSSLVSGLALPWIRADEREMMTLGLVMPFLFLIGMSVGSQVVALAGAGVGLALGLSTASRGGRKRAGARGASRGAWAGLVVGAALGYLGAEAYSLPQMTAIGVNRGLRWLCIVVTVLLPMLGAGLGLLAGARKSARARGSALGALAGAALAVMVGGVVLGLGAAGVKHDPSILRQAAYGGLVSSSLRLERHADAARAAQEYAREFPDDRMVAYNAACYIACCVPLAERDPNLSADERQKTGDEYGRLAVQQLRAAVQAGYRDVQHIKKDPDLDALRHRQDFRELLAELGAGP